MNLWPLLFKSFPRKLRLFGHTHTVLFLPFARVWIIEDLIINGLLMGTVLCFGALGALEDERIRDLLARFFTLAASPLA